MAVILDVTVLDVGVVRLMASTEATFQEARSGLSAWSSLGDLMPPERWVDIAASPVGESSDIPGEMVLVFWMPPPIPPSLLTTSEANSTTSVARTPNTIGPTVIRRINVATFTLAGVALFGLLLILSGVHLLDKVAERTAVDAIVLSGAAIVSLAAVAWILIAGLMIVIMVSVLLRHSTVWTRWRRRQAKSA